MSTSAPDERPDAQDLAADGDEVLEGVEPPTKAEHKRHRAHAG